MPDRNPPTIAPRRIIHYKWRSLAHEAWPKNHCSITLCNNCGDSFELDRDLREVDYTEILRCIRTGHYPFGQESTEPYTKLMDATRDYVDQCDSVLGRLDAMRIAVEEQRDYLLLLSRTVDSIISPIYKLPLEILGEIFTNVCCGDIGVNGLSGEGKRRYPTLDLSRVCSKWRNMVISMPVLWTSLGIDMFCSLNAAYSFFKRFLGRSSFHPVDFTINYEDAYPYQYPHEAPIFPLLESNCGRWRHVCVRTSLTLVEALMQPIISSGKGLPRLESLSLNPQFHDHPDGGLLDFPVDCPNLRALKLVGHRLDLKFPRPTITSLMLAEMSPSQMARVIANCPNVQALEIEQLTSLDTSLSPVYTKCNAKKIILCVGYSREGVAPDSMMKFVDLLILPELNHIILSDPRGALESRHVESLCNNMIEHGYPNLTHLTLDRTFLTAEQLLQLFLSMSSITYLKTWKTAVNLALELLIAPGYCDQPGQHIGNNEGRKERENALEGYNSNDDESEDGVDAIEVPEGKCLLPKLQNLELVLPYRLRGNLLLAFLRSRWKPLPQMEVSSPTLTEDPQGLSDIDQKTCVSLQKLCLRYTYLDEERDLEKLQILQRSLDPFRSEGMDIEVLSEIR
ncbi:hypothetical protein C8J55DRAFT_556520 [Lentinula edodes]|uniref:F-box domain-containing protein n=1 Tax=Lentinula lateritia TaxID=40482 RepID=A0A9W9AYR4_9AGAR|nr:hypothetical protein C8J55DRAFT_556520 [Lentinula edodes]